jgi:hypothetical protein
MKISLYKFVRYFLSGEILSSSIYLSYINMLIGLSTGEESSQHCFVFLQNNSHFYDSHSSQNLKISLNHILSAFERYYDFFKMDLHQQTQLQQQQQQQQQLKTNYHQQFKGIAQNELQGLILVCKLVTQIIKYNEKIRVFLYDFQYGSSVNANNSVMIEKPLNMYTNQFHSFASLMFGLLTCPIPTTLKVNFFLKDN